MKTWNRRVRAWWRAGRQWRGTPDWLRLKPLLRGREYEAFWLGRRGLGQDGRPCKINRTDVPEVL